MRQPPPGTEIVKTGSVKKGDWFYADELNMWMLVPTSAVGDVITTAIVARKKPNPKLRDAAPEL